eukprot:CAMPEP_0119270280 /NCGR_PEP_ID=MMETSP1329-20130426/7345_1 /TAXON_ID=114041 /ORGANISM="Genus nov. species nov., Strain RCC1024" /LENGTH=88 /DNA_ID=CAMNT_0007270297 /DNA_START=244 /DNA_END=506 /DNA_ORIENTATION=-
MSSFSTSSGMDESDSSDSPHTVLKTGQAAQEKHTPSLWGLSVYDYQRAAAARVDASPPAGLPRTDSGSFSELGDPSEPGTPRDSPGGL